MDIFEAHQRFCEFIHGVMRRSSLVEVLSRRGGGSRLEYFARVRSVDLYSLVLNVRGRVEPPERLDLCGAMLQPCDRGLPLKPGWVLRLADRTEWVVLELTEAWGELAA